MTPGEVAIMVFIAFASTGLGTLVWKQLAIVREEIASLRAEMQTGDASLRAEMREGHASLRAEMHEGFASLRNEMREGDALVRAEMRADNAALRSDLTQVALAVGARRTRASEG